MPRNQRAPRRRLAAVLAACGAAAALNASPAPGWSALAAPTAAKSADAFVDTIGVGLHVGYTRTPYWGRWDETKSALLALGVRHFRDGVTDCAASASKAFCRHYSELGEAGLTGDFVTGLKIPMGMVAAFPAHVAGVFDTFEGPNEVDISGDPNWLADLSAYQQQLYATVKNDPALAKHAVIGPAIGHIQNYAKVNDLSAFFDYGNLHDYLGPVNPGTDSDGRIRRWVTSARSFNSSKPDVTTETGYWDGPAGKGLPDSVIARYEPRLFLEQFEAGVVRTYQYEFIDEGSSDGIYSHAGLLTADLAPKPQYYALQSLISTLRDPGPAFTLPTVDYTLGGNTDRVDRLLFAKRDGSIYLALWLEKPSYDVAAQREIAVPAQQVSLTVAGPVADAGTISFDDNGRTTSRPLSFRGQTANLSVTDRVLVVRFSR